MFRKRNFHWFFNLNIRHTSNYEWHSFQSINPNPKETVSWRDSNPKLSYFGGIISIKNSLKMQLYSEYYWTQANALVCVLYFFLNNTLSAPSLLKTESDSSNIRYKMSSRYDVPFPPPCLKSLSVVFRCTQPVKVASMFVVKLTILNLAPYARHERISYSPNICTYIYTLSLDRSLLLQKNHVLNAITIGTLCWKYRRMSWILQKSGHTSILHPLNR